MDGPLGQFYIEDFLRSSEERTCRPRWQSGGVQQAEMSTSAKGHLADRNFASIYVSSLHR
jgi:hypothetical protein